MSRRKDPSHGNAPMLSLANLLHERFKPRCEGGVFLPIETQIQNRHVTTGRTYAPGQAAHNR